MDNHGQHVRLQLLHVCVACFQILQKIREKIRPFLIMAMKNPTENPNIYLFHDLVKGVSGFDVYDESFLHLWHLPVNLEIFSSIEKWTSLPPTIFFSEH